MPKLIPRSDNKTKPTTPPPITTHIPIIVPPSQIISPTNLTTSTQDVKSTKHPRKISINTFVDEDSENDDVLNENVSADEKVKEMEKAQRIINKYKTDINCKTNPTVKTS